MSNTPQFGDYEFVSAASFNTAAGLVETSANDSRANTHTPGLVNAAFTTFSRTADLVITTTFGASTRVLFGSGVIAGGYGTVAGAISSVYATNLAPFIPLSGNQTVYVIASPVTIGQSAQLVTGPPVGHQDYDPTFVPYTLYTNLIDSVAVSATLSAPDNSTAIELYRVTLTAGQSIITSVDLSHQVRAGALLSQSGEVVPADLDRAYALLAGSSGQVFNVANAVTATEAVALGQFVNSLATTGYAKLPGGLILQWTYLVGPFGVGTDVGFTVNFPFAFPGNCLFAIACPSNAGSENQYGQSMLEIVSFTKTQMNCYSDQIAGGEGTLGIAGLYLLAIGN
jgi:hypothetical protein